MSQVLLGTEHVLPCLIFTPPLRDRYYWTPYFIGKKDTDEAKLIKCTDLVDGG